jgi:dTDP-4-amino-4,6-dideoxygalactose transaminase
MGRTFGYTDRDLPVTNDISGRLLRLPLFYDITEEEQARVVDGIRSYLGVSATAVSAG